MLGNTLHCLLEHKLLFDLVFRNLCSRCYRNAASFLTVLTCKDNSISAYEHIPNTRFNLTRLCHESCYSLRSGKIRAIYGSQVKRMLVWAMNRWLSLRTESIGTHRSKDHIRERSSLMETCLVRAFRLSSSIWTCSHTTKPLKAILIGSFEDGRVKTFVW